MEETGDSQRTSSAGRPPRKGTPNARWSPEQDKALILYLAEEVRQGLKVQKSFKAPVFHAAAAHVNRECNSSFTESHVKNHFKTLKARARDIKQVLNLSGAGWDDEKKIIILDSVTAKDYVKDKPQLKQYVNKRLELLDELFEICGDDDHTGSFARQFIGHDLGSTPTEDGLDIGDNEISFSEAPSESSPISTTQMNQNPQSLSSGKEKACKSRLDRQTEAVQRLVTSVDNVAVAIHQLKPKAVNENELWNALLDFINDFSPSQLEKVYDYLLEKQTIARGFLPKDADMRRHWLVTYVVEHFNSTGHDS